MTETAASVGELDVVVNERLTVRDPLSSQFYAVYRDAFDPLAPQAAARHVLGEDEWRTEMLDDRILKLVASAGDEVVGLATVALDIRAVPWASASFYEQHFPGRQIYYTGVAAVDRVHQNSLVFEKLLRHGLRRALSDEAVCAFDCSSFVTAAGFPDMINRVTSEMSGGTFTPIDTQTYYVFDTAGEDVVDLRTPTTESSTVSGSGPAQRR